MSRTHANRRASVSLVHITLGWLGLSATSKHGELFVHPTVSVQHHDLARLVAELCEERFHPYSGMHVSPTPRYVLSSPERDRDWRITADGVDDEADDLLSAVEAHGLPFMRERVGLGRIRDALEAGPGSEVDYLLPTLTVCDERLAQIEQRAVESPPGASRLRAWAWSTAAVEVIGGKARPLRRKRRNLKGIYW